MQADMLKSLQQRARELIRMRDMQGLAPDQLPQPGGIKLNVTGGGSGRRPELEHELELEEGLSGESDKPKKPRAPAPRKPRAPKVAPHAKVKVVAHVRRRNAEKVEEPAAPAPKVPRKKAKSSAATK